MLRLEFTHTANAQTFHHRHHWLLWQIDPTTGSVPPFLVSLPLATWLCRSFTIEVKSISPPSIWAQSFDWLWQMECSQKFENAHTVLLWSLLVLWPQALHHPWGLLEDMKWVQGPPVSPKEPSWNGAMAADGQTRYLVQLGQVDITGQHTGQLDQCCCCKSLCFRVVRAALLLSIIIVATGDGDSH